MQNQHGGYKPILALGIVAVALFFLSGGNGIGTAPKYFVNKTPAGGYEVDKLFGTYVTTAHITPQLTLSGWKAPNGTEFVVDPSQPTTKCQGKQCWTPDKNRPLEDEAKTAIQNWQKTSQ